VRATLTGLGAGLVFGIQDALTRQTLEIMQGSPLSVLFTNWPPYCLLGAGIVGLWLMQNAFSAGPLHSSLPTIAAGEPVAGMLLGIIVFGDRVQVAPTPLAIEAGGIAALIVGVVMVARSSAFGGLRKITDVIRPGAQAEHEPDTGHAVPIEGSVEIPSGRDSTDRVGSAVSPSARGLPPVPRGLRNRRAPRPDLHRPASGGEG
jgi:hypothetical protein